MVCVVCGVFVRASSAKVDKTRKKWEEGASPRTPPHKAKVTKREKEIADKYNKRPS
jgi:hypothetical protein